MSTEDRKEPVADSFFIAPLEQLVRDDVGLAGGKGANLGELVNAGFPVPQGFAVTTDAYDLVLKESGLGRTIAAALEEAPTAGATIREAFLAAGVPRSSIRRSLRPTAIFWARVLLRYARARRPKTSWRPLSPASRTPS
jgi:hypothetical protein